MTTQSRAARWVARAAGAMSVSGMCAFSARRGCRYNRLPPARGNDGNRGFLGQRQSLRVAGAAGARIQASALCQPPAAVLEAGAQVAADARPEPARPRAGAQG